LAREFHGTISLELGQPSVGMLIWIFVLQGFLNGNSIARVWADSLSGIFHMAQGKLA
jgi:hypothetical protein